MINSENLSILETRFPELIHDPKLLKQIKIHGQVAELPAEQHICLEGDSCTHLPLMLNGTARVYKLGESGREITLYRIEPGDSCILTLSCINSTRQFPAFAVSETPIRALLLPANSVRQWMEDNNSWRNYAWSLIANRLSSIITLVEEITFQRMDQRLAEYLRLCDVDTNGLINLTHQNIAADLGTSREVISRLLKDLQQKKIIELGRGWIKPLQAL